MREFVHVLAGGVGVDDRLDVFIAQAVLVLALFEILGGVDEEDVVRRPVLAEHQHDGRNRRGVEQVARHTDHGIEVVLVDDGAADGAFGGAAEQHAVGEHDGHAPGGLEDGKGNAPRRRSRPWTWGPVCRSP